MKLFNNCCKDIIGSITQCIKNKYFVPSLALIYSGIDIMAWFDLPINQQDVTGKDFISWAEKYLLPNSNLECNAVDLWAARCGIIHTSSFSSKMSREGKAKEIYYAWGNKRVEDLKKIILFYRKDAAAIHIDDLFNAFKVGIEEFKTDIRISFNKRKSVYHRTKKFIFANIFTKDGVLKLPKYFDYDEILNNLAKTEEWINKIGLETNDTRLDKAKKNLILINHLFKENKIYEINKSISNDEGIESMFTCSEFNYIYNCFGNYRNINELKPILKKSLGGALRSKVDACRDKNIVSNHFFQLELASFLAERNFKIEGLNDINFLIDKFRIIIQRRRPFLENNMEDNILNAYSQLNKITKGNEKGIIAIAVDKILVIDNKILDCKNMTDVIREENKRIDKIKVKFSYIWKKFLNINIIGIFLFVKFKFKPWDGSITLRRGLHIIPLYPNSAENRLLIEEIGKRLKMPIITNDFILPDFSSH